MSMSISLNIMFSGKIGHNTKNSYTPLNYHQIHKALSSGYKYPNYLLNIDNLMTFLFLAMLVAFNLFYIWLFNNMIGEQSCLRI